MRDRTRTSVRRLLTSLRIAAALTGAMASPAVAAGDAALAVPFLPQTEALCGGAAAAMIYRYWGDAHADVQQFAPLVDRRAGGIAERALIDAIRAKGWQAVQSSGSIATLRAELVARRPVMLLVEDRPNRYHFIVAVGATDADILVHDPTWGPNRRMAIAHLERVWSVARFWMLVVTPDRRSVQATANAPAATAASTPPSACDRRLDAALDAIAIRGLSAADAELGAVRQQCPDAAGPLRELAGIRLAQSRWQEASALSGEALRLDAGDAYARDVLAASLFVQNKTERAIAAWNHIGKPTLDSVEISGVTRMRYALLARVLGLVPNTTLTAHDFAMADRRLALLPDRIASRTGLVPGPDGFAKVTATLQETSRLPQNAIEWGAAGVQTIIDRQLTAAIAGGSGQGELWTASWRWWENRPRVAVGFAAPKAGWFGGVWRVDASWERQTYGRGGAIPLEREERRSGGVSVRNWLAPALRYELRGGVDVWDRDRRTLTAGGALEMRLLAERLSLQGGYDWWHRLGDGGDFAAASAVLSVKSSLASQGLVATLIARADTATAAAPLALWSGAGEGRARPSLLRAHRLLHDGVIDGPVFGRTSGATNLELQRWFTTPYAAVGVAGFADIAAARHRLPDISGHGFQFDAGAGLRARVPGRPGTFRVDYAHGLSDSGHRWSAGWNVGF